MSFKLTENTGIYGNYPRHLVYPGSKIWGL